MTYFLKRGSNFTVTSKDAIDIHEKLPAATFSVRYDKMSDEYYLEIVEDLQVSTKIYGDAEKNAARILATFEDRPNSTGVVLSGEKGSGKTLLAKLLSVLARRLSGYPTIVINQPWFGDRFNSFVQMIEQETVIIFDEFEKVYSRDQQEKMLTLLDGVYPSKKLFILTCNDRYRIDAHMRNRPGRIFYRIDYAGLEEQFIREYCDDNLKAKEHTDSIVRISVVFSDFNFDMLKAIVEEMNRYGETAEQAIRLLNATPELSDGNIYDMELIVDDAPVQPSFMPRSTWRGNPLSNTLSVEYDFPGDEDKSVYREAKFDPGDIVQVVDKGSTFHYQNSMGERLTLVKHEPKNFDWMRAF